MIASMRWPLRAAALSAALILSFGCAPFTPRNVALERVDPERGYRPFNPVHQRDPGKVWLFLAFSGGGTRAAAFAYGVLEELRDTTYLQDGQRLRLLDEVDSISGVSGGSFPAAYYGLFGDRIFEEFEERFLKKNVQRSLMFRALWPWNLLRLMTPSLSRSGLASDYYHSHVFDKATFKDLAEAKGPRVHINATDLPSGNTIRFNQDAFDLICTDLDPLPISVAVAASSAVPVLLSPITLRNYAGSCGFEPPAWLNEALQSRNTNPRGHRAALAINSLLDSEDKKYIHLIDGGVSDNLGIRLPLDRIALMGGIRNTTASDGLVAPDHIVVVIVNAETSPDPLIDLQASAPSLAASMNLVSGSQIRRYNFESLLLMRSSLEDFQVDLSTRERPVTTHLVEVSFDRLADEAERHYFKRIPTTFFLSDSDIDKLRAVGRRLLSESAPLSALLEQLNDADEAR